MRRMDTDYFKQRLLALERSVSTSTGRALAAGAEASAESTHDAGDLGMAAEVSSEKFAEAELSSTTLLQIRGALARLEAGTFGDCVVDGAPIEAVRLAAVPWTPYCLEHAQAAEDATTARMPTL